MSTLQHQNVGGALFSVVQHSLEQTLKTSTPNLQWQINAADSIKSIDLEKCVVLTISSFKFRVMCLLHLSLDDSTRKFVAEATSTKVDALDDSAFLDYLLELSNSFCGNIKRHLQTTCPPLGMSTPNLLDRSCLDFNNVVDISHSVHTSARTNPKSAALFAASVLVSLQDNHGFNVRYFQEVTNDGSGDDSGELELF
jgi:CheY-specific phosphatase CheX